MIKSIQFMSGYPLDIPAIGRKPCVFSTGINVLIGKNGSGKSTIINTLKGYSGIDRGGWTSPCIPGMLSPDDFPQCYTVFTPGNCQANVVWDGTPTFFNNGDLKINEVLLLFNIQRFGDGITDANDLEKILKENPSSGQYRLLKLNKIFNMVKNGVPEYDDKSIVKSASNADTQVSLREIKYWNYIKNLYKNNVVDGAGKATILLDEPERALSLSKQRELFLEIIPTLLADFQVIIATHSIYSIFMPNASIIEMEKGYIDDWKFAINDIGELLKK